MTTTHTDTRSTPQSEDRKNQSPPSSQDAQSARDSLLEFKRSLGEHEYMRDRCVEFQKRRAYGVGPVMLLMTLVAWALAGGWELGVVTGVLVAANASYWYSLSLAKQGRVEVSLLWALVPTLAICASVILLVQGFETAMILTATAIVVQMAIFSNRISAVGVGAIFFFVLGYKVIDVHGIYQRMELPPTVELGAAAFISAVMAVQIWLFLKKHRDANAYFLHNAEQTTRRQRQVIELVRQTVPVLDEVLDQVAAVSNDVTRRASEQSAAMTQMAAVVQELTQSAVAAAQAAAGTQILADETQKYLTANTKTLVDMRNRFSEVTGTIEQAKKSMEDLLSKTDKVESILAYNREIGENIKVLSVNASIEAAEAGEFGAGFAVVAKELREMIDSTEGNLVDSRTILSDVRNRSRSTMEAVENSWRILSSFDTTLSDTQASIAHSVDRFGEAIDKLRQIVATASEQERSLAEITQSVHSLQAAAKALDNASHTLVGSMNDIRTTQKHMADALKVGTA